MSGMLTVQFVVFEQNTAEIMKESSAPDAAIVQLELSNIALRTILYSFKGGSMK